jgi:hypothetical protein
MTMRDENGAAAETQERRKPHPAVRSPGNGGAASRDDVNIFISGVNEMKTCKKYARNKTKLS